MKELCSPTPIERRLAGPMFGLSVLCLLLLAGALHLHDELGLHPGAYYCLWGILALYPVFVAEGVFHLWKGSVGKRHTLVCCLLPPLRMGARDHVDGRSTWLPRYGWVAVDDALRGRLEKAFSLPMILIALMVLPLMAVEHFAAAQLENNAVLAVCVEGGTALIWFAFTLEFIVMISIVERKWQYARQHWIDILVILLPLVAFLRAARLGRLLRLQQLTKTVRVYRLRGLLMRLYRAVLLLDAVDRLLRPKPERRLAQLRELIAEREQELDELRSELRELESSLHHAEAALHDAA